MRASPLVIIVLALLGCAILLTLQAPPETGHKETSSYLAPASPRKASAAKAILGNSDVSEPTLSGSHAAAKETRDASSSATARSSPPSDQTESASSNEAIAIRLSEDLRLPAVLLPSREHAAFIPSPVAGAVETIRDDYYRHLAGNAASGNRTAPPSSTSDKEKPAQAIRPDATNRPDPSSVSPGPVTGNTPAINTPDGENNEPDTVVIEPGPDADDARRRADEAFRALFGNAAYNQHAIDSGIEVHLTPLSESAN